MSSESSLRYFVRHGQTDWNAEKKLMGRADIPLNEAGREQARAVRDSLKDTELVAIITSPLSRARETADIIAEYHEDVPVIADERLIERDFGDYEGLVNDGNYFGLWNFDGEMGSSGESPKQVLTRVTELLDQLGDEYDGDILLVGHGGVGLLIDVYFSGVPDDGNLLPRVVGNGEIRRYN